MQGVNKVILVGNLGKDPEVRTLESGAKVATFSVATTESYKDRNSGERVDKTEWHNIVLWRGLAEIAEKYLKKGGQVYIEGKLQTRNYEGQDNITRYTTEIVGLNLTLLGRPNNDGGGQSAPPMPTSEPMIPTNNASTALGNNSSVVPDEIKSDGADDDLPF